MTRTDPTHPLIRWLTAPWRWCRKFVGLLLRWSESLDRVTARLTKAVSESASQTTDRADSGLSHAVRILFWPLTQTLKHFWRIFLWVGDWPISKRWGKRTKWLWAPPVAIASFTITLIRTRSRRVWWWSMPLVLLLATCLYFWWQVTSVQRAQILQQYAKAIDTAIAQGHFEQAALYQQKLRQLGSSTEQLELQAIEKLADVGRYTEALGLAERLAPRDQGGSPAAHYWAARAYLDKKSNLERDIELARAAEHLRWLRRRLPQQEIQPEIEMLDAMIQVDQFRFDSALERLGGIASQFWPAAVMSFEINSQLQRESALQYDSQRLLDWTRKSPGFLNEVSSDFFRRWSDALLRSGNLTAWRQSIQWWSQRYPEEADAKRQWVMIQLDEISALANRNNEQDLDRAANLLCATAAQLSLNQRDWLTVWLSQRLSSTQTDPRILAVVRRAEVSQAGTGLLWEILGTMAAARGESDRAVELLERAVSAAPDHPVAWNNLAYILNLSFPNRREEALAAAQTAIRIQPDNPDIRETRGMIFLQLKRWQEAIDDLQLAVAAKPQSQELKASLALAQQSLQRQ